MISKPTVSRFEAAKNWIIGLQDSDLGGWPEFKSGHASSNVSRVSVLGTAEALLALREANPPDDVIERGLMLLCSALLKERPNIRWLYTRHYAIGGLALQTYVGRFPMVANGKYDVNECITRCLKWLIEAQNPIDGGWGHAYDGKIADQQSTQLLDQNATDRYPSKTSATFMVLRFLVALPDNRTVNLRSVLDQGKAYLTKAYIQGNPIWGFDYEAEHDPASTAFALVALKLCDGPRDGQRDVEPALDYLRRYEREHRKEDYLEEIELGGDLEDEFGHLWVAWTGLAFLLWGKPLDDPTVMSCVDRLHALQARLKTDGSFRDGGFSKAPKRRSEIWTTYASLHFLHQYVSLFNPHTDLFDLISEMAEAKDQAATIKERWEAFRKSAEAATINGFLLGGGWFWVRASWTLGSILLVLSLIISLAAIVFLVFFTHLAQSGSIVNVIAGAEGVIMALAIYLHTDQRLQWHKSASISLAVTLGVIVASLLGGALPMLLRLFF